MDRSIRIYRFAYWGILSLVILHFVYYMYIFVQFYAYMPDNTYSGFYMSAMIKRFLIVAIIMGLEILVYWFIRRRLYRRSWVRTHVILLWTALILLPLTYGLLFLIGINRFKPGTQDEGEFYDTISIIYSVMFWGSMVIAHLFFIATIVKSFSKKELTEPDATDSPDILDEFNQQSAGI